MFWRSRASTGVELFQLAASWLTWSTTSCASVLVGRKIQMDRVVSASTLAATAQPLRRNARRRAGAGVGCGALNGVTFVGLAAAVGVGAVASVGRAPATPSVALATAVPG